MLPGADEGCRRRPTAEEIIGGGVINIFVFTIQTILRTLEERRNGGVGFMRIGRYVAYVFANEKQLSDGLRFLSVPGRVACEVLKRGVLEAGLTLSIHDPREEEVSYAVPRPGRQKLVGNGIHVPRI